MIDQAGIAGHLAVEHDPSGSDLDVADDLAVDGDKPAGQRSASSDLRRWGQRDVVAGGEQLAADCALDADIAARSAQGACDRSAHLDRPAGEQGVTFHRLIRHHATAEGEEVALHGAGRSHRATGQVHVAAGRWRGRAHGGRRLCAHLRAQAADRQHGQGGGPTPIDGLHARSFLLPWFGRL
ncbi:MAG TPA: hypothetical protein VIM34_06660 [Burkholderiaceae bacterium]